MNRPRIILFSLVILTFAVTGASAGELASVNAGEPPAPAESSDLELSRDLEPPRDLEPRRDLEPPQDLEPPLESAPIVETSCWTEDCGNTGTLWGEGPEPGCNNGARADLNSNLYDAALNICPGVVTGMTYHYDNNCTGVGAAPGNCRESGNADVECKICPGQYCF